MNAMEDFHEWNMVFETREEAELYGHPDAPFLAEYGADHEKLRKYLDIRENLAPDVKEQVKAEDRTAIFWGAFFFIGTIVCALIGIAADSVTVGLILDAIVIIISILGFYYTPKLKAVQHKLKVYDTRDDELELYLLNIKKYVHRHNSITRDIVKEIEKRPFTTEEINAVAHAIVIETDHGRSVQINLKGGGQSCFPLNPESTKKDGDKVDITKAILVTYTKGNGPQMMNVLC